MPKYVDMEQHKRQVRLSQNLVTIVNVHENRTKLVVTMHRVNAVGDQLLLHVKSARHKPTAHTSTGVCSPI